jgi:hypothetical protein
MEAGRTAIVLGEERAESPPIAHIPPAVLRHPELSFGAKVLFAALHAHAWPGTQCWPSQDELAREVSCTVRQVQRLLLQLRRAGFVAWKRRGLNRPNLYRLALEGGISEPAGFPPEADDAPPATPPSSPDATHWSEMEATVLTQAKEALR